MMAILKGYFAYERQDIIRRKEQLDVALDLLERGFREKDRKVVEVGIDHSFLYLELDVNELSIVGVIHWNNVVHNFYDRYYSMIKRLETADLLLEAHAERY